MGDAARVAFRTDAGSAVGLGHLSRCLALAHALRNLGAESRVLIDGDHRALELALAAGFEASAVAHADDPEATLEWCGRLGASALVVGFLRLHARRPGGLRRRRAAGGRLRRHREPRAPRRPRHQRWRWSARAAVPRRSSDALSARSELPRVAPRVRRGCAANDSTMMSVGLSSPSAGPIPADSSLPSCAGRSPGLAPSPSTWWRDRSSTTSPPSAPPWAPLRAQWCCTKAPSISAI